MDYTCLRRSHFKTRYRWFGERARGGPRGYPRGGSPLRETQARDVRVRPRHHAGPRFGQGARPGRLRRPRRRVPRRLVDRGPVPSALRARPRPLRGGPRRRLRQQRLQRQPVRAQRPDQPEAGQKQEEVRKAAAGARRRGADRGVRVSHHRQPDHPEPACGRSSSTSSWAPTTPSRSGSPRPWGPRPGRS